MKCHNIFFIHAKVMEKNEYRLRIPPTFQLFWNDTKKDPFIDNRKNTLGWSLYLLEFGQWRKKENLKNEFLNRIEALDKKWSIENILEKTTRFCHNETQKEYLPKIYDPFLHGISRGRIKKLSPFQIITKTYKKKNIRGSWINKIHGILLKINSQKFEQTIEKFKRKSLSIEKTLFFFRTSRRKNSVRRRNKNFQNFIWCRYNL